MADDKAHSSPGEPGPSLSDRDPLLAELADRLRDLSGGGQETLALVDQVAAHQQALERQLQERARELALLLRVSNSANSTLDLDALLSLILDQVKTVVDYDGMAILTQEGPSLVVQAYRGPIPQKTALHLRFPLAAETINREVIRQRRPVILADTLADTDLARRFRQAADRQLDTTFGYIRSWMGVPLLVREQVVGMLTLDHSQPEFFTPEHAGLVMTFANHVAAAIENASRYHAEQERLQESERRRRVAEGLRGILRVLNSNRPIDEVLHYIAEQACDLMDAAASIIHHVQLEQNRVVIEASCGLPGHTDGAKRTTRLYDGYADRAIFRGEPYAISDLPAYLAELDTPVGAELDEGERIWRASLKPAIGRVPLGAFLAAPLLVGGQVYGSIVVYYHHPREFSDDDMSLAVALGDQVSLAIENATLRTKAAESAVAGERNRLARDLHDAVTQTLFSASLIAEVLPRLWETRPDEGRRRLIELREMTRGALAEMRTLLLELRPSALVEARLTDLLRQLGESITGRARVPVEVQVEGDWEPPAEVKVALYRIAQEALNNIAKHSGATHARVQADSRQGRVWLCVSDDGLGFDPASIGPNSLGVGIMRERAETIGAALRLDSRPGEGTQISALWPANAPSPTNPQEETP